MSKAQSRKNQPIYSGVLSYFPKALRYVSQVSHAGNQQHHPDEPLHWDRAKSTDEPDALMRHLTDHAEGTRYDDDGLLHLGKVAWRALALLEKELEKEPAHKANIIYNYGDNFPGGYSSTEANNL